MAEAKAETANKKKRIKDEIQFIPSRIDEAEKKVNTPNTVGYGLISQDRLMT